MDTERAEALFPLRATTTAADSKRDARAAPKKGPPYSGAMNPRARRLIVSGVLGGLVLIVLVTAAWNWLR